MSGWDGEVPERPVSQGLDILSSSLSIATPLLQRLEDFRESGKFVTLNPPKQMTSF